MQTLRIQPITAMFQPLNFAFNKEAQASWLVNQWKQQLSSGMNARSGKPLSERQKRDIQSKLDAAPPPAPAPASEAPVAALDAQAPQDPAQAIQTLMQSVKQFGSQFNQEIIAYNQHIKQVHQSIAMLQKIDWNNSTVDPNTVMQQASALQQTLDTATAEQAQDMAFLQQLAIQAAQLAQSAGGAGLTMEQANAPQPAAPEAPAPGMAEQIGGGLGTAVKAPGRALNWMGNQVGKGLNWVGQQGRNFGRGFSGAESDFPILTASMGSPSVMFLKQNLTTSFSDHNCMFPVAR